MSEFEIYRKRGRDLLLIMAAVAVSVGVASLTVLYRAAFEQEENRLAEIARSSALLLDAMARFNQGHSHADVPGGPFAATMLEIREAHGKFRGFGKTGEFTLAKREGEQIVFLLAHRHYDLDRPRSVPFDSQLAQPMRAALSGRSGTMIGIDYRGARVLAAFEPVATLGVGIVAKIDLDEVREPFVHAAAIAGLIGLFVMLFGTWLFLRIGSPLLDKLVENERKYRALFEQGADVVLIGDAASGRILEANDRACATLGYTLEELGRLSLDDIGVGDGRADADGAPRAVLETQFRTRDGALRDVLVAGKRIDIGRREVIQYVCRDVTERLRLERELKYLATHDPLTGLYNRSELENRLAEEVDRALRYGRPVSLFVIDIDRFKRINDEHGHQSGDEVLRVFARKLAEAIRRTDVAGRYGGEEFLAILPETPLDTATQLAERLRAAVAALRIEWQEGRHLRVTVSLGVAALPDHGTTSRALVAAADRAMYRAKGAGRDRCCVASESD